MFRVSWLLLFASICIGIFALTEIITFLRYNQSYMIGSESMISNGGFRYKNNIYFLSFYLVQIIMTFWSIILFCKVQLLIRFIYILLVLLIQIILLFF
jgi:hypothetical protein